VTERDETIAESGDDSLGAAVANRRDGLVERGDLSDSHVSFRPVTLGAIPLEPPNSKETSFSRMGMRCPNRLR
jgi:hypothetical protein